jgi:hypothetical protein
MIASNKSSIEASTKKMWMTKERWESIVTEMPEYEYVDPVMYEKYAKKLGMTYSTFWKWYNVWYAIGKDTKMLPFIKTEAEIKARDDERRNRKKVKRVSDLPKIQWRR